MSGRVCSNKRLLRRLMDYDGDVPTGTYDLMQKFFRDKAADPDALENIGREMERANVA